MPAGITRFTGLLVLVMALSLGAGGSDAVAQSDPSDCPNQDETRDYNCPVGPTYLVPGLTDIGGWNERSHYRNILFGNLIDDKADEMVVRGAGGLQVYRFDRAHGQWTQLQVNQLFSDDQGWAQPRYYETIRLGDLDGDGFAELVARGGGTSGITVYKFAETGVETGTWTQANKTAGPMPDVDSNGGNQCFSTGGCWGDDAKYYSTIQLTSLGRQDPNKPTMQLIGRGGDGLELWKWNGSGWDQLATLADFSDDPGGWDSPQYYSTIMPWDENTLIARGGSGLLVYEYTKGGMGSWKQSQSTNGYPFGGSMRAESSYSTLQPFRGVDGGPVILGRGSAGAQLWRWTPGAGGTSGRWDRITAGTFPFSDAAGGWDRRRYYRTIQAADIDGDGLDELLARTSTGMVAYSYKGGTEWDPISTSDSRPALADDPWGSDPSYYETIKTVRLDPSDKPARSLIARGPHGIRTWRFDGSKKRWTRYRRYGFPALPDAAYRAVNNFLKLSGQGGIRDFYNEDNYNQGKLADWRGSQGLGGTCAGSPLTSASPPQYKTCMSPDSTVTSEVWTGAANQIIAELFWAEGVLAHFGALSTIQKGLFLDDDGTAAAIEDDLKLAQAEDVTTQVNYLELFEGILDILALIPEAGKLFEFTAGALGIADGATEKASQPTKFDHKVADVQNKIIEIQEATEDTIEAHRSYVLKDYGLMSTVGQLNQEEVWRLDGTAAVSASRQGFTKWLYQNFLPTLWVRWTVGECYDITDYDFGDCVTPPSDPSASLAMTSWKKERIPWTNPNVAQPYWDGAYFDGLLPKQNACGSNYCQWYSLENENFADPLTTLRTPVSDDCKYVPGRIAKSTNQQTKWSYGRCTLGIQFDELYSKSWGFPYFKCSKYYNQYGECGEEQPHDSVMDGQAGGLGSRATSAQSSRRGSVYLSIVSPLKRDLDLRRARVGLGHLLHEAGGAQELVKRMPRTLRVRRGAKRHRARFETRRGRSPRIRGVLSVHVRKVRVRRGRKTRGRRGRSTRIRRVRTLKARIRVDRATLKRPQRCDVRGAKATHLGVHVVVRPRRGRLAQVLGRQPWSCQKGGRMRYRAPRSRAHVTQSRVSVRGRRASIPLRCRGKLRCIGGLVLHARLGGGRAVVIGRARVAIRAGRRATVRVRLSARARRALATKGGGLPARAKLGTRHPSSLVLGSDRAVRLIAR